MMTPHRTGEGPMDDSHLPADRPSAEKLNAEAQQQVERLLAEQLIGGDAQQTADPAAEAVRRLPPKWEIRIQTTYDPVAEETRIYRQMAKEVDDRYDRRRTLDTTAKSAAVKSEIANTEIDKTEIDKTATAPSADACDSDTNRTE